MQARPARTTAWQSLAHTSSCIFACMIGFLSSMMFICFFFCRRVGLFLPFIFDFSSALARCAADRAALAAASASRRCWATSTGSFRTWNSVAGAQGTCQQGKHCEPVNAMQEPCVDDAYA
eukprot:GHUV01035714.1.p1 GENE.GHUV01035714.1~~GHUV01035714.1.p1  ORF type:complete len:120 (-),score=17.42 GHUV01035714.1:322-681(-)